MLKNQVYCVKMYFLYSLLLLIGFCVYFPIYFVKIRLFRKESLNLRDRLGFHLPSRPDKRPVIWIHAVSVGEILSLQNLITQLKDNHPDWKIYLSTLTQTGLAMAKEKLSRADEIFFIPFDFRIILNKFFTTIQPQVFVLVESEFWPNLLHVAHKQAQTVMLINGRISQRSGTRHYQFRFFSKKILNNIDLFHVQTDQDKNRLARIGVSSQKIEVTGNLKADVKLPAYDLDKISALKKSLNISPSQKIVVAGSTHRGEDQPLLAAFKQARAKNQERLFIIAPRHLDRVAEIEKIGNKLSLRIKKRTGLSIGENWEVLILDTMGELAQFYALGDAAFIGGSLIPWGGQNLMEPAFYAKPIFFGPHMENFAHLAEFFVQGNAANIVEKEVDLKNMFLIQEEQKLIMMGEQAKKTLDSLQGATQKALITIEALIRGNE